MHACTYVCIRAVMSASTNSAPSSCICLTQTPAHTHTHTSAHAHSRTSTMSKQTLARMQNELDQVKAAAKRGTGPLVRHILQVPLPALFVCARQHLCVRVCVCMYCACASATVPNLQQRPSLLPLAEEHEPPRRCACRLFARPCAHACVCISIRGHLGLWGLAERQTEKERERESKSER